MKNGLLLVLQAVILLSVQTASAVTFTGIGDLPGGSTYSVAQDISADGTTVVGRSSGTAGFEAYRWTSGGGMVPLGDLPGGSYGSHAYGVSSDGSVVVGNSSGTAGTEAFRWNGGGLVPLGDLSGGGFYSESFGVSGDGSTVVGTSSSSSGFEAFRWTSAGGMVGLGDLSGGIFSSQARGASADGSVVVGYSNSTSGHEAFRWTSAGGIAGLGDLPGGGFESIAYSVSADGKAVVGYSISYLGAEAFRWTSNGGMVGLGDLPGGSFSSFAYDVSADGSVIVGLGSTSLGNQAFIWTDASGMVGITEMLNSFGVDLTDWSFLHYATGVSANGRVITGNGTHLGNQEGWVADFSNLDIHWSHAGSGNWTSLSNWSGSANVFLPGETDDVSIDPTSGLTVTGPTEFTTVDSLSVGAQTSGTAVLNLPAGSNLNVNGQTTFTARGRLTGAGVLNAAGGFDNLGEIDFAAGGLELIGGTLNNQGLIRGEARIENTLSNSADGEVRAESGRRLLFTGSGNTNAGEINISGGTVEFKEDLQNASSGFISGRGTLIADGGLSNSGVLAFSAGLTDVYGDVTNSSGGRIVTSGGATTTFYDDVIHNGTEIRTSAGSSTVIFGDASGAGPYTGTGDVFFEGDLRPGNSPAAVNFEGNVSFGLLANFDVEIGGLISGSQYDQLLVSGDTSLDGGLSVSLLGGFTLSPDQSFKILSADGVLTGTFAGLGEGDTVGNFGGEDLMISYLGGDGNDVILFTQQSNFSAAIPEPGSLTLLGLGWIGLCGQRRRRR